MIRVGAATETEMKYLKLKIEDAVNATKAAIEEGIVPGGGTALVKAANKVGEKFMSSEAYKQAEKGVNSEFAIGYNVLINALYSPLKQIAMNSGKDDGSVIVEKVKNAKGNQGYDAKNGLFVDMLEAGIVDPVKVTRSAVQNAASAAAILLTTEVAVAEEPKEEKPMGGSAPGMGDY